MTRATFDRRATVTRTVATLASLALVSLLVVRTSAAVWSDTTASTANSFASATVTLSQGAAQQVPFDATGLLPGDAVTGCIEVVYDGSAASGLGPVELYATLGTDDAVASTTFSDYLNVAVDVGVGASCGASGFDPTADTATTPVSDLLAFPNAYGVGGVTTWTPSASGDQAAYLITVTLDPNAPNAAQGKQTTADLVWEIQTA